MKIADKKKVKNHKNKKKLVAKPQKEKVLIVAQEIKFARLLSDNDKKIRDRALKSLKKWLLNCFQKNYEFKEDDFSRIWKGLFYAVWMSDKPLVQEDLCESIASILDLFPTEQLKHALLLVKTGFKVLATEWYGIDQHRMDKCLMLVRRYLRGSLRCVRRTEWSTHACQLYAHMLTGADGLLSTKTPVYARNATSMILHILDCFLEELAKVSEGRIPPSSVAELLKPFCLYLCHGCTPSMVAGSRRMLAQLLRQSDAGLEYHVRTKVWEEMGCPEGGPDALQPASDDDDDDQQNGDDDSDSEGHESARPLDPRAGRVDVTLAQIPVPAQQLADILRAALNNTTSKAHLRAKIWLQRLEKLSSNEYPLGISAPPSAGDVTPPPPPTKAARSLATLEKTLVTASDELALRGLSRKHRKRLLAKSRAGLSIVEDLPTADHPNGGSAESANGDWKVEEEPQTKKKKKYSNKENIQKNKKRKLEKSSTQPTNVLNKKQKLEAKKEDKKIKQNKKIEKHENKVKNAPAIIKDKKDYSRKGKNKKFKTDTHKLKIDTQKPKIDSPKSKTEEKLKNDIDKSKMKTVKPKIELQKTAKSKQNISDTAKLHKKTEKTTIVAKKVKNFQKQLSPKEKNTLLTPKKVKFVLQNNSMQQPVDYYRSVKLSPSIPFDSSKKPVKTNLKPSTPSPINPFFKKKLKLKNSC